MRRFDNVFTRDMAFSIRSERSKDCGVLASPRAFRARLLGGDREALALARSYPLLCSVKLVLAWSCISLANSHSSPSIPTPGLHIAHALFVLLLNSIAQTLIFDRARLDRADLTRRIARNDRVLLDVLLLCQIYDHAQE